MAEGRIVPCNLMAWPKVRDMLPDQKLLVYHLWATSQSSAGCNLVDYASFQGALSITMVAIENALHEFERRTLIDCDWETGEAFILDWFRFHKFDGRRQGLLILDLRRIQSTKLLETVHQKIDIAGIDLKGDGRGDKR